MCVSLLFSTGVTTYAETDYPRNVPEYVRKIDGMFESVLLYLRSLYVKKSYPDCIRVCDIPDLDGGYVPQGFCYIDSIDAYAVSSYSGNGSNSIISVVDAKTGNRIKTVKLCYEGGSKCDSHVGGIADIADSLIFSTGKSVRRIKINDIMSANDYSEVKACGKLETDMQSSYLCSYKNYLFVGQFYCYTSDGKYDTPTEQRIYLNAMKRNYAMCEQFDLTDIDAVFKAGKADPEFMISMPNIVQGIAFDGDTFVTSTSYSQKCMSKIRYYKLKNTKFKFNVHGKDVPLYILSEKGMKKDADIPPMAEGIDFSGGKVMGIFESGAKKFKSPKIRTPYICEFK